MLEHRLDERLQGDPDDGSQGLASRWKNTRQEREASTFDLIADQIESGALKIRGAKPDDVVDRLRTRARDTLAGKDRMRRRRTG